MPRRRVLPAVLRGFLGTFTSRYSDLDGYWLFGFLAGDLDTVTMDLLEVCAGAFTPLDVTRRLAAQRFAEQVAKSGLPRDWISAWSMSMASVAGPSSGNENWPTCWVSRLVTANS